MGRKAVLAATGLALAGLATGVAAAGDRGAAGTARPAQEPIRFSETDVFVEINATDGDAGLQMQVGGDPWTRLRLMDPRGRTVMDVRAGGPLAGYGATDIGFESNEPPFDRVPLREFRQRFRPGRYTLTGVTPRGRRLRGSDRLTHDFPAGPTVVAPREDAVVDRSDLVVRWRPNRQRGIEIIRYEVIVTQEEPTEREFIVQLGADATTATVSADFLAPGREYAVEVIARERSGNQTITEIPFRTAG